MVGVIFFERGFIADHFDDLFEDMICIRRRSESLDDIKIPKRRLFAFDQVYLFKSLAHYLIGNN